MHTFLTSSRNLAQDLALSLVPSTSDRYTLFVNLSPLIRSTFLSHFETFQTVSSLLFFLTLNLVLISSFFDLSILVTPHSVSTKIRSSMYSIFKPYVSLHASRMVLPLFYVFFNMLYELSSLQAYRSDPTL